MSPPDCIVMEEHHEAFYFWREALLKGSLPRDGCALVHIDEHADLEKPFLKEPMIGVDAGLDETRAFVVRELNIGNFIWPAMLQRLFTELWWHRQKPGTEHHDGLVCVLTTDDERRRIATGRGPLPPELRSARDAAEVRYVRVRELEEIRPSVPVVLDVCLDYFSCYTTPQRAPFSLEVTESEFARYSSDPYHLLRITPGAPVTAATAPDGRRFLVFGSSGASDGPRTAGREEALARLDRFAAWLRTTDLDCRLIDISMSRLSGYTPPDICDELLERLGDILADRFGSRLTRRSAFARADSSAADRPGA